MNSSNKIIIITAPSGAGKTSITRHLINTFPQLAFSISAATRSPRANEIDGQDYYFISEDEFIHHIEENDFVEWEMVYEGKYYGTLKSDVQRIWNNKNVPILDIDVKGAIHVQNQYTHQCLSIFIEAPTIDELKKRLESRGTETEESIATRISKAEYEISFKQHFNKIIVNKNLNEALIEAEDVVRAFLSL